MHREAPKWKRIETAPQDGTQVLAWQPTYYLGRGGHVLAIWQDGHWWATQAWKIDPTHWMPLPAPPETNDGREK